MLKVRHFVTAEPVGASLLKLCYFCAFCGRPPCYYSGGVCSSKQRLCSCAFGYLHHVGVGFLCSMLCLSSTEILHRSAINKPRNLQSSVYTLATNCCNFINPHLQLTRLQILDKTTEVHLLAIEAVLQTIGLTRGRCVQ